MMPKVSKEEVRKCERCNGCGKIANDEEGTPWSYWESLPPENSLAIRIGVVKPLLCPECNGYGQINDNDYE